MSLASTDGFAGARVCPEPGRPWQTVANPVSLFQASSGGTCWDSSTHVNRHRMVALDFQGYELATEGRSERGLRASPTLVASGTPEWAVAARYFWQVFPKAISVTNRALIVSLFPAAAADPQELQPGEQTTFEWTVAFGEDAVGHAALEWVGAPTLVHAAPPYYTSTGAIPYLTPESDDPHPGYTALVRQAIEGPDAFEAKRETIDEFGWRHFGDVYGDHEAVFHKGPAPLVSHWNNQYDTVFGALLQFLRSGDARWWTLGLELAAHVEDIDIYHTTLDKNTYNGGLFWHTYHYVDADTATHRSYPARAHVNGGGPAGGHVYTTGLLHAYLLTGQRRFRDAAIGLGDYVINADDGRLTLFRWLDTSPTGHASASGSPDYHGPGRAPANSINALVDAHRLTGDQRYLDKALELLFRCVHPIDDVAARDLFDVELKWFYTMFFQSLGKLLDHLDERGQQELAYFHARESLLRYARWMLAHERPYLDHPEQLEYPTETWAAQDMRKSDVLQIAARHASGPERERFFTRATEFFTYSVDQLSSMPTRGLCRPVALMLVNGWTRAWHVQHLSALPTPPPLPALDFPPPRRFVPQKRKALRKLKALAAAGAAAAAAALALAAWYVLAR